MKQCRFPRTVSTKKWISFELLIRGLLELFCISDILLVVVGVPIATYSTNIFIWMKGGSVNSEVAWSSWIHSLALEKRYQTYQLKSLFPMYLSSKATLTPLGLNWNGGLNVGNLFRVGCWRGGRTPLVIATLEIENWCDPPSHPTAKRTESTEHPKTISRLLWLERWGMEKYLATCPVRTDGSIRQLYKQMVSKGLSREFRPLPWKSRNRDNLTSNPQEVAKDSEWLRNLVTPLLRR